MNTLKILINYNSRKKVFFLILLLTILSIFEAIGFAVLMPLISMGLNFNNEYLLGNENIVNQIFVHKFKILDIKIVLNIYLAFAFIFYFSKFLYTLMTVKLYSNFLFDFRNKITKIIFERFLKKEYLFHLNSNSSELVRFTSDEVKYYFDSVVAPLILVITEIFIISGLVIFSFVVSPYLFITTLIFSSICYLIIKQIKNKLPLLGKKRLEEDLKRHQILQQIFLAIKDIKIFKKEDTYLEEIKGITNNLSKVDRQFFFTESLPRYIIEFLIVLLFCSLFYLALIKYNIFVIDYIPILGIYILIIFRLMPSFTRISRSINAINYSKKLEDKIYDFINSSNQIDTNKNDRYTFNELIEVNSISYSYPESKNVIKFKKKFKIRKGTFNCIVGSSGSGKTTLIDILSGLLIPNQSDIKIDGKNIVNKPFFLNNKISFVHQNFYLFNDTLEKNITFMEKQGKSNSQKIKELIKICELDKLVNTLPEGINTIIGESGAKLSGGERQRISIARALYAESDIIFFDEATNALDKDTEQKLLKNLKENYHGKKTFIFVLHKIIDKSFFDQVIELN